MASNGWGGDNMMTDAASKQDRKYDRQLRLWGARGQRALMESHILLVHAGPTGTELLKNLVLPGVGRFTILDDARVGPRDLANNFFVTHQHVGQPRAQVAATLLKELNPDVQGQALVQSPEAFLASSEAPLAPYNLVVATQCTEAVLSKLAGACAAAHVPLLVARSYGLVGYLRLQLSPGGHCIVDAKVGEENKQFYNLALAPEPLPAVQALADGMDLEAMDHHALSRVPFVVLLLKAKQRWLAMGESLPPQGTQAKMRFAEEAIKALASDPGDDNFAEALKRPYLAYQPFPLPEHTQELFADPRAAASTGGANGNGSGQGQEADEDFWVVVRAIKGFVENEGRGKLPLSGAIPDMASSTENYSALQAVYREQGAADRRAVLQRVGDLLEGAGRPRDAIPAEEVEALIKDAYTLQVMRTRSLGEELSNGPDPAVVHDALEDGDMLEAGPDMNPILFYLGLRAVDRFHAQHGRYPGQALPSTNKATAAAAVSVAEDEEAVWALLQAVAAEATAGAGAGPEGMEQDGDGGSVPHAAVTRKHAAEMVRYGAAELHNVAAILGGIGSQEAVKVLTQQYVPFNNTFVYNGLASTGGSYCL